MGTLLWFQADPRFVWNRILLEELIECKVSMLFFNLITNKRWSLYSKLEEIPIEESTKFPHDAKFFFFVIMQLDVFSIPIVQGSIHPLSFLEKWHLLYFYLCVRVSMSAYVSIYCA